MCACFFTWVVKNKCPHESWSRPAEGSGTRSRWPIWTKEEDSTEMLGLHVRNVASAHLMGTTPPDPAEPKSTQTFGQQSRPILRGSAASVEHAWLSPRASTSCRPCPGGVIAHVFSEHERTIVNKTRNVCAGWKSCVELGGGTEATSLDHRVCSVCWHKMCMSRLCTREAVICPWAFSLSHARAWFQHNNACCLSSMTAHLVVRDTEDEPRGDPQGHPCHQDSLQLRSRRSTWIIIHECHPRRACVHFLLGHSNPTALLPPADPKRNKSMTMMMQSNRKPWQPTHETKEGFQGCQLNVVAQTLQETWK